MAPTELTVGDKAPDFEATITDGTTISLSEILSSGDRLILYFYPRDNTPGCTTQACDFRDNMALLQTKDIVVLGVSKDSEASHEKFISKQQLNFPLLMDTDGALHETFGTWRMKKNYGKEYMGCVRSTFVIQPDGTFKWLRYNVRAKGHVSMLMRELEFTE